MVKNKVYFADNDLESLDISTLFEYIEITGENAGDYGEVKKKIIKYFMGSALTTFIQKSKVARNYNELKREMVKRYDIKKFFKPEDELSKLTDQKFDKFMKYITAFESLNAQINPPLTSERQIELFIRGVSDIEIKKSIDEDKYIDKVNINIQVQQPQIQQPTQAFQEQPVVKQEQTFYTNYKKPQYKKNDKYKLSKCFKCGKNGHYANQCNEEEINSITEQVAFTANQEDLKKVSLFGVLLINDQPTRCLIDTGSTITMIHESFASHLGVKLEDCDNELRAANGSKINIKGKTSLTISTGTNNHTIYNVYVTNHFNFKCLLGINSLKVIKANIDICNEKLTSGDDNINLFTFGRIPVVKSESFNNNQVTDRGYQIPFHAFLEENVNVVSAVKKKLEIRNTKVYRKEERKQDKVVPKVMVVAKGIPKEKSKSLPTLEHQNKKNDRGTLNPFNNSVTTNDNYVGKLKETINKSLEIAKTKTQESQTKQKQYYDGLKTRKNSISPGDYVLLKNQTVKEEELKKFRPSWIGPFKVVRILSNQTIQVQVPLGSNMSTTQSLRNCKRYFNRINKLNQLPSFVNQPSQVSMNELSFSRLINPSIVVSSPPPAIVTPQHGQAVTQLPVVLPKSNRAGKLGYDVHYRKISISSDGVVVTIKIAYKVLISGKNTDIEIDILFLIISVFKGHPLIDIQNIISIP
ncbi:hypothetical protein ACTFIW_005725 [Dictyostelium discoideum]